MIAGLHGRSAKPEKVGDSFFGWTYHTVPDGPLLNEHGGALTTKLALLPSHAPGDIVTSRSGATYMVRPDFSLSKIGLKLRSRRK